MPPHSASRGGVSGGGGGATEPGARVSHPQREEDEEMQGPAQAAQATRAWRSHHGTNEGFKVVCSWTNEFVGKCCCLKFKVIASASMYDN